MLDIMCYLSIRLTKCTVKMLETKTLTCLQKPSNIITWVKHDRILMSAQNKYHCSQSRQGHQSPVPLHGPILHTLSLSGGGATTRTNRRGYHGSVRGVLDARTKARFERAIGDRAGPSTFLLFVASWAIGLCCGCPSARARSPPAALPRPSAVCLQPPAPAGPHVSRRLRTPAACLGASRRPRAPAGRLPPTTSGS